ncbi:MAG TPA: TolC family outer membrane protein [Rhodocyclaceae bacterium]|nr:TolC family outer membrane protein [Rhodocyclaceae bacterium]
MRLATLAVWACFLALTLAAPARGETLQQAVAQALQTNPDVLIDLARRDATGEGLKQARAGYLPRIDLTLGRGRQHSDNATTLATYGGPIGQISYERSVTLTQMLFDGYATSNEVERSIARIDSSSLKLDATSEQVALRAVEAYLEVLRNQEILSLTQNNLVVHQRTYDQIKLRADSGVGRKADLDQIEARLALAKSNLTAAQANLKIAEINYRLVVGSKPSMPVRPNPPDPSLIPKTPEAAIKIALADNPLLKSAQADIDAADAQYQAAKSIMYPTLSLEIGANDNTLVSPVDVTPDSSRSAMVRLRYNLFKGSADTAHIAETRYLVQEAEAVRQRTERQLEQSVRLSWNAYTSSRERLPFLAKHAEASRLTRDAYVKQFSMGQRTLLDVLDTENEAFTASSNYLNGQYVELFARYRVLADIGLLLDTLGVHHLAETKVSER